MGDEACQETLRNTSGTSHRPGTSSQDSIIFLVWKHLVIFMAMFSRLQPAMPPANMSIEVKPNCILRHDLGAKNRFLEGH